MKVILVRSRAIDPAVHKVAKTLSENGYDVKLLLWDRKGDFHTEDNLKYEIIKFRLKAPYDKPTALFYLPIWWIYEFLFLMRYDSTIIHAFDFDTLIPAILSKIFKKGMIVYTIYDFYADNLPDKVPGIFKHIVAYLERKAIGFSKTLFLVDKSRLKQVAGAKIKRIEYVYNSPPDYSGSIKMKMKDKSFKIFYAGIIHRSRGLSSIIEAIKNVENINFVIAGTGPYELYLKKTFCDVNNIKFLGQIDYDHVISETFNSDVLIALYDPKLPNNKFASPNKLFEAMMSCKPIIINSEVSASNIVQKEECGFLVNYGDVESLKNIIIKLRDDPSLCEKMGRNGRKAYEHKYNWKIMEEKILKVYRNLSD